MALHRYVCTACNAEVEQLERRDSPVLECCGDAMARAMPRRVVGRCVADSDGAHAGSGFARPAPTGSSPWAGARLEVSDKGQTLEVLGHGEGGVVDAPRTREVVPVIGNIDDARVPAPSGGAFAKDFADCHAGERDARWRDTAEAIAATTVPLLEGQGLGAAAARVQASQSAQAIVERSRSEQRREGPT